MRRVYHIFLFVFGLNSMANAQVLGTEIYSSKIDNDTAWIQANVYYFCNSYFQINDSLSFEVVVNPVDTVKLVTKPRSITVDTVYTNCDYCGCPDTFCTFPFIVRQKMSYVFVARDFGLQNICEVTAKISPGKRFAGNTYINGANTTVMTAKCKFNLCFSKQMHQYNFNLTPRFYALEEKSYIHAQGFSQVFDSINNTTKIDLISSKLVEPTKKFGKKLQYKKGYDYLNPLQYNGYPNTTNSFPRGFHLNSETGDLRFRSTQIGEALIKSSFTVVVDSGVLQEAEREFILFTINNRNENTPYLTGKNSSSFLNQNNYKIYACWGKTKSSFFIARDRDNKGIGNLKPIIPSALKRNIQFKVRGDSLVFEYNFDSLNLPDRPLKIEIVLEDTLCSSGSESSFSILFFNNYIPVTKPNISLKQKRLFQLNATLDSNFLAEKYSWRIDGKQYNQLDTTFELKTPGDYNYRLISYGPGGCNDTILSIYKTPSFPYVKIADVNDNVCEFKNVTINSSYFHSAQSPEYSWNGQKLGSVYSIQVKSDTTIILNAEFNDGTINSDTLHIKTLANPFPKILAPTNHCSGNKLELTAVIDSSLADSTNPLVWLVDNDRFFNQEHLILEGEKRVTLFVNYENSCVNSVSEFYNFNVDYESGIDPFITCPGEPLRFKPETELNYSHTLFIADTVFNSGKIEFEYPNTKQKDTLILVTQFDSSDAKCIFRDTIKIDVLPIVKFQLIGDTNFCANDRPIAIHDTSFIKPTNGTWLPPIGKLNAISKDSFIPSLLAPVDTQYVANYTITNPSNGCKFNRDVHFAVKPVFAPQFVADSIKLCIGGNNVLLNSIDYAIPSIGNWAGKGVIDSIEKQYFSPSLVGVNSTNTLNYVYTGSNGCSSKSKVVVTVNLKPNPVARVRSGVAPISISFSDLRDTADCQVDEWFWDFYDNYGTPCTLDVVVDTVGELFCRYSTAPNPVHRYRKSGIYPVKLVVRDSKTGVKDSITRLNYIFLIGNSVNEQSFSQISIYPNPTSNGKMIIEQDEFDFLEYQIFNTTGKLLKSGITQGPRSTIDYEEFKGLLLISVSNREKTLTYSQRVLVK
ncbi:MAG: T9SS type A sorting domain-containing protein [Bacteroidia bacterium]